MVRRAVGHQTLLERPGYTEFRLGDYQHELGLIDSRYAPNGSATGPAGAVVYWHVDNVANFQISAIYGSERIRGTHRARGFITASVVDPFGNILGIMYNQHYLEVLGSTRKRNFTVHQGLVSRIMFSAFQISIPKIIHKCI